MAKLLDVEMLVVTSGGRQRTEAQFRTVLDQAGLRLTRILSSSGPVSLVAALARD